MKDKSAISSYLSLFDSSSTIFCCALPSLFVLLGAGATFASFTSMFPFIYVLTSYKPYLFLFGGTMLSISGFFMYKNRNAPCPIDPTGGGSHTNKAKACGTSRKVSKVIFIVSLSLYLISFIMAYVVPRFL